MKKQNINIWKTKYRCWMTSIKAYTAHEGTTSEGMIGGGHKGIQGITMSWWSQTACISEEDTDAWDPAYSRDSGSLAPTAS